MEFANNETPLVTFFIMERTLIFIILIFGGPTSKSQAFSPLVQLPTSYTAMKGEIAVSYSLNGSYFFKSFNAMIHLEYLPGDAILTNSHSTDSSVHLARY